ncbi:TPA: tail fiber assembly protein [Escherichia coli]|nr:tail fiber assembly protein [Escherichia coli]EJI1862184.1 tail fiber assembly protein [Escherichia coli]HAL1833897.1 tail fiber assembly protein [Escherichia coli]HBA7045543.1 tail fiber assembly protein [Escherichia coli]HBA7645375.1 tail fiber assembly protein [Escherichia coli]
MSPRQDAAGLEIATNEEALLLEAWKKYRILISRYYQSDNIRPLQFCGRKIIKNLNVL